LPLQIAVSPAPKPLSLIRQLAANISKNSTGASSLNATISKTTLAYQNLSLQSVIFVTFRKDERSGPDYRLGEAEEIDD
jgi:hypothetical protein